MGYYGTFDFDIKIPAQNVAAAELALRPEGEEDEIDIVSALQEIFYDADISFEPVNPLTKLALAGADKEPYGDLLIGGGSHQKWRDYIENTLDTLAPFIEKGSTVFVQGEEGERVCWRFDGKTRDEDWATTVYGERMGELEGAETALRELLVTTNLSKAAMSIVKSVIKRNRPDLLEKNNPGVKSG